MSLYKDEAVVLRGMRLGEADRIVSLIGRASGKIRAVAKGVRKTKSRFGGRLEPFTHVSIVMWRGRGDLDTVTQVEVINPFRKIREDLDRFAMGEIMLESMDRVVQERERTPGIFNLLIASLDGLAKTGSPLVLASFLLRLSGIAGFAPVLNGCAECGEPAAWFSPLQGGAICFRHRDRDAEEVGPQTLELMADLVGEGAWMDIDLQRAATVTRLARFYTEYHLDKRLRSAAAADRILS